MTKIDYSIKNGLNAPVEEAYRVLRSNIQFCGFNKKIKSLVITSCKPGEGKTTTCFNLAISMAKAGMNVLLVDADLHKPMVTKHLGSENLPGLSSLISGYKTLDDAIHHSSLQGFSYLSSGPKPPNPAELIASRQFSELLGKLTEKFDIVIFDSPPIGSVIDCALIASQVDGTILVIESKAVDYKAAIRSKEQLEKANARILGVVINKIKKADYRSYYGSYKIYKHYSEEEKQPRGLFGRPQRKEKEEVVSADDRHTQPLDLRG